MWYSILLVASMLTSQAEAVLPNMQPIVIPVQTGIHTSQDLAKNSDQIILATPIEPLEREPQNQLIEGKRVVKFRQIFQVKQTIKGVPITQIKIELIGLVPEPRIQDPLNEKYPGPLGSGDYFLFLKKGEADHYNVIGSWKGIYPVFDGRTVTITGLGFPELGRLTPQEMIKKIRQLLQ
ncbi:hypothetical protein [Brevibacillus daliensis]|uniref:hypothetical protein n=1 Tax=Brevibacillus daliensis TaxID=2892995 RepID=UPI001E480772|nr:hypothetical protein [Brevibacillus daliensis]